MAQVSNPLSLQHYNPVPTMPFKIRLDNLPQIDLNDPRFNLHRRQPSEASSISSEHSIDSWPTLNSDSTVATDITVTPPRSRATTSNIVEPTVISTYVPRKPPVRVVLGTASVGSEKSPLAKITSVDQLQKFTSSFRSRGYADIDTARAYPVGRGGSCEKLLGEKKLKLGTWANTSTKVSSFMPGSHKTENIRLSIDRSLEALNVESVDIMYLHAPDSATPFFQTCEAMNEAYMDGKFERFGLSNYSVEQVEKIVEICELNGFVMPTVYQGQYNPICRGAEDRLFQVLRKNNMAFYAYSPSACGFFSSKVSRASSQDKDSRWNVASPLGAKYAQDYFHDPLFAAAEVVRMQAKRYGISGHAAALRWTTWHSQLAAEEGDAVIIGASRLNQLEENLDILEQGPLPQGLVKVMDQMWDDVKALDKGPRFSFV